MHELHEFVGCLQLFGGLIEFILTHADEAADLTLHETHMTHGLYDISRARLTLRADHRGTLGNTAQGFSEVLGTADEGHVELGLVDVVDVVGW